MKAKLEILRDRKARTMTITHRKKISDPLSANSMQGCRSSPTPLVPKEKLKSMKEDPYQKPATVSERKRYMKVVGGTQYIVVTRPDIAFAAHSLARHMGASAKVHWLAAQHIMRYLQKTVNLGLQFSAGEGNSVVEAYSDFANALSLKSVSGNMLMMYGNCVFCVMTKCQGTHACVAAVHQWRWCDSIGLLWFATVDDDHCDCLSLRH